MPPPTPRPLHELKRRLSDSSVPLSKRLRLAANVATTQYFPAVPKERILAEWLAGLAESGLITGEVLQSVLEWFGRVDEPTVELQGKTIEVVAKYLQNNVPERENVKTIIKFLESEKILSQLTLQIHNFLFITTTLLSQLNDTEISSKTELCPQIFKNIIKVYKAVTKKVDFIIKFLDGETLETIFKFLDSDVLRSAALHVSQVILFPPSKKQHYVSFLHTLIKKESIDQLLEEKGDNIKSVLKVMSAFFAFPKGRTSKDAIFLINFIDSFVTSYKTDSQLIFAFFIMAINSLNIQQTYLNPTISMPTIHFDDNDQKIKRNILLKALDSLMQNEIDLNVRLTETLGEKQSKVEIKKKFSSFLQAAIMKSLKLEGKPDKTTLKIITLSLNLDPNLIEPKLHTILPNLMISKKNKTVQNSYTEMLNCILETLFKLNKGMDFFSQMLPVVKIQLEAINTEQFQLKQKLKIDPYSDQIKSKIVVGEDLFPKLCVDKYGRLTSELMLRQCGELFVSLQREFEEHCLILLSEGFVSPSLITLAEVLSAVLSSCLCYNKMADHTVPLHTSEEFWSNFQTFEKDLLRRFGECLLKLSYNGQLALSFLQLCLSYSRLKLLNIRYSNLKLDNVTAVTACDLFDFSNIMPCLNAEQWLRVASRVNENEDAECAQVLNHLQLVKIMALDMLSSGNEAVEIENCKNAVKSSLIKDLNNNWSLVESCPSYAQILFSDLDKKTEQELSKSLVKLFDNNQETILVLNNVAVSNNRTLLKSLAIETLKSLLKIMENKDFLNTFQSLRKAILKDDYDISEFARNVDIANYFVELGKPAVEEKENEKILNYLEILKMLKVQHLEENYQLTTIFVILALKMSSKSKKIIRNIDSLLLNIFELSPKNPDLFKIFPVKFIFDFEEHVILNLITLNRVLNPSVIVKAVLETATKKVKIDSEIIKNVVKILLTKQKIKKQSDTSIEHFSDKVFQITCMALPIIAKEKKSITTSAYRSILAELQEKLHDSLLKSFKNVDLEAEKSVYLSKSDIVVKDSWNEGTLATLNAIESYSLTLSKYCDSANMEDSQNLDCLLSSLEYFIGNAIVAIQNQQSKPQHVDACIQLLNVIFRRHNVHKLATHTLFQDKDKLFLRIWQALKCRLTFMCQGDIDRSDRWDEMTVAIKFLSELCSVTFFMVYLAVDLANLMVLVKPPSTIIRSIDTEGSVLTSHRVARFLWISTLKANVTGPKSAALQKAMYQTCKNLKLWLRTHYVKSTDETVITEWPKDFGETKPENDSKLNDLNTSPDAVLNDVTKGMISSEKASQSSNQIMILSDRRCDDDSEMALNGICVHELICELLKCDLEALSEVVLNAKKISLNYKFMDAIFEVLQLVNHCMLNCDSVPVSLALCDAVSVTLNSLLLSRDEMLEDRWPCYLQCYRALVLCVSQRSTSDGQLDRALEERLAETAHYLEKLTQAICKRRSQISRLAAYLVADICSVLERTAPSRLVRQHLENSVALLIQASESTYAMSFLRRALAGNPGQMTMTNLYTMYKRYHKYVGTS